MADIYYSDGSVGIGTMARSDDNFNFDPVLDISGTRGALTLRATIDDGLTTLRFKGPDATLADDWHINMRAGDASSLTIAPRASTNGPAMTLTNNGDVGIGTSSPTSKVQVIGGYLQIPNISNTMPPAGDCDDPSEIGRMLVVSSGTVGNCRPR
jgi:hypothetical protein